MISKYHNHKPQTTPWHREEEPLNQYETPGIKFGKTESDNAAFTDNRPAHDTIEL